MTIKLEYISVLVPIAKIKSIMGEGAFEEYFDVNLPDMHHDGEIYREGCMNEFDLGDILDDWEARGFQLTCERDGEKHWKDVCVAYSGHGPSYPCDWLNYDPETNSVSLVGPS